MTQIQPPQEPTPGRKQPPAGVARAVGRGAVAVALPGILLGGVTAAIQLPGSSPTFPATFVGVATAAGVGILLFGGLGLLLGAAHGAVAAWLGGRVSAFPAGVLACGALGALIGQFRWGGNLVAGALFGGLVLGPVVGMEVWREWLRWRAMRGDHR